jgi:Flp pilus assembly protein TadD
MTTPDGCDAPAERARTRRGLWESGLAPGAIALAAVLVYSNTLAVPFQFDDTAVIANNLSLRDWSFLWPPAGNRWVGFLTFALNYQVGGTEVTGYHLANLVIHVVASLLVYWLVSLTLETPALADATRGPLLRHAPLVAGLLFAVHPLQTQAVTYVVQRFASLATLLYLLSLVLFVKARLAVAAQRPWARAVALYCGSLVVSLAAMKTKEISFTLPFVAAAYELTFFRRPRRFLWLVPLLATALSIPAGLAEGEMPLRDALQNPGRLAAETDTISRWTYLLTETRVVVRYLRLLVLPVGQNLDYDFPLSHSIADPRVLLATAILAAVVAAASWVAWTSHRSGRAEGRLVAFGIGWIFVTLAVESSLVPIQDVIFEHRMYLPMAGAALAAATLLLWGAPRLLPRLGSRAQVASVLVLTVLPLGAAAYGRNAVWEDAVTLWSDVVSKSPEKPRPHLILGSALLERGRVDEALRELGEAQRLDSGQPNAELPLVHTRRGRAYLAQGEVDRAEAEFREAIRVDPGNGQARFLLGRVFAIRGRSEDAIREYRTAFRLDPAGAPAQAHQMLADELTKVGSLGEAIEELRVALRLAPQDAALHAQLGHLYERSGLVSEAIREYEEFARLEPANAAGVRSLIARLSAGRPPGR